MPALFELTSPILVEEKMMQLMKVLVDGVNAGTGSAGKLLASDPTNNTLTLTTTKTAGGALGTIRTLVGAQTLSGTAITSGTLTSAAGRTALSGTVTGGAFITGLQGKLTVSGTMNHADSRLAAVMAQLDTTGATLTTGQISALWVDHGAGVTGAGGGQFNMIRITNTVAGSKPNAVIYAHSNATYVLDLSAPGGTMDWLVAAGTSAGSAGKSDGCAAQKVLTVLIGGVAYFIPAFDQNT